MTADCTSALRATLAQKIAVNAFILLLGSLFIGAYVLDFFGLSVPIVQVGGGLVVCANAWDLLRAEKHGARHAGAPRPSAVEIATPRVLPADAAAHRRARHDLRRDHDRRPSPAERALRCSSTASPTPSARC